MMNTFVRSKIPRRLSDIHFNDGSNAAIYARETTADALVTPIPPIILGRFRIALVNVGGSVSRSIS
jgi:hypothetical protein